VYTQNPPGVNKQDIVKGIGFSNSNYTGDGNNVNIADNDINILNTGSTDKFINNSKNNENVRYKKNERLINFNKEF